MSSDSIEQRFEINIQPADYQKLMLTIKKINLDRIKSGLDPFCLDIEKSKSKGSACELLLNIIVVSSQSEEDSRLFFKKCCMSFFDQNSSEETNNNTLVKNK